MDSRKFIEKIHDLPTISAVANQINLEERKRSLTAKSLGAIIAKDPALTAKVLKLANSAYYGLVRQVTSVERAVTVLGFQTIKNLALTVSIYKAFQTKAGERFDLKGLWQHSLGSAVAAKQLALAACRDQDLGEMAFLSGIVHDIGKIAIAQNLPEQMATILQAVTDMHASQNEVEQEMLGFTHQKVGALLADNWNFPDEYIRAIKHHHGPFPARLDQEAAQAVLIRAVYVGNQFSKVLRMGRSTDPATSKIPVEVWRALGIARQSLPGLRDLIVSDHQRLVDSWQLDDEPPVEKRAGKPVTP